MFKMVWIKSQIYKNIQHFQLQVYARFSELHVRLFFLNSTFICLSLWTFKSLLKHNKGAAIFALQRVAWEISMQWVCINHLQLQLSTFPPVNTFGTFCSPFLSLSSCDARSVIDLTFKFIHNRDLIVVDWDILKLGRAQLLLIFCNTAEAALSQRLDQVSSAL